MRTNRSENQAVAPAGDEPLERADYDFGLTRRGFVQTLGAGLLISVLPTPALGQRRGERGEARPQRVAARVHIDKGGARKVIISAPATNQDYTVVMGINHKGYDPKNHNVISNASCTTNCFVPVAKVLHDAFGIERGMMTTIHAYTSDQKLQDLPHKDLRRARAAADNIIPTSTGANRAVAEVLPELTGKFAGMAFRVPVLDVSVVDLTVQLAKTTTAHDINAAFDTAAGGDLRGILAVSHEELVSSDFKSNPHSSIVDAPLTLMLGGEWAKVVSWYDNEWGFSCRMVDLIAYMADRL